MPKCYRCGKWGLFLKVTDGFCDGCLFKIRSEARKQTHASSTVSTYKNHLEKSSVEPQTHVQPTSPPKPNYQELLDDLKRNNIPRPEMLNGIPMVYSYVIRVSSVNHKALFEMTSKNEFSAEMSILEDGNICLKHNDIYLGILTSRKDIATDWVKKQLPYICEFSCFRNGEASVVLHLYRDDETRLKQYQMTVAKLTSCTSEEKQENIMLLEKGQKLFVEEDDNGKWYVRDINYHEIGRLPARFNRMHEDGDLRGIFFDHTETAENANGYDYEIPYVRFYY